VFVAAPLDEHVQDDAFVIHGSPQPHALAADLHHHLVQMPPTGRARRRRRSAAISGPNLLTQQRLASRLTTIPRWGARSEK
jgi:hypothetical protein